MAQLKGRDAGAISSLGEQAAPGVPPHWNSYVTVTDVDATASQVPGAGGTVIAPPFDVLDAGRMAVIQDPTGAIFMIWQPKNSIGAGIVNEHGAFSWSELISPDVPKAAEFYKKIFGWTSDTMARAAAVHGVQARREEHRGRDGATDARHPAAVGHLLQRRRLRRDCREGEVARRCRDERPDGHRARPLRGAADPQGAMFNVIKFSHPTE
jgi:predicted enzyme related to lactoylglutathione lyase